MLGFSAVMGLGRGWLIRVVSKRVVQAGTCWFRFLGCVCFGFFVVGV